MINWIKQLFRWNSQEATHYWLMFRSYFICAWLDLKWCFYDDVEIVYIPDLTLSFDRSIIENRINSLFAVPKELLATPNATK